jgi:hypothetical protein
LWLTRAIDRWKESAGFLTKDTSQEAESLIGWRGRSKRPRRKAEVGHDLGFELLYAPLLHRLHRTMGHAFDGGDGMSEEWREVPNCKGLFVSSLGRVKREKYGKRVSFGVRRPNGYMQTSVNGRLWLVHRLVMHVFCGESSLGVNHKNGIKDDNRLENLEYCTQGENVRHAISIGRKAKPWDRRADKGPTAKFTWDDVRYIRSSKENSESLSRKFNVYSSTIRRIRSNKTWVVS